MDRTKQGGRNGLARSPGRGLLMTLGVVATVTFVAAAIRYAGPRPASLPAPASAGPVEPAPTEDRLPDPASARVPYAGIAEPTEVRDVPAPGPTPEGMGWVPPGRYSMGSD